MLKKTQKKPLADVFSKKVFLKIFKVQSKAPASESLNVGLQAASNLQFYQKSDSITGCFA